MTLGEAGKLKRGTELILNNGKGMIGHGRIVTVSQVRIPYVYIKAKFLGDRVTRFYASQLSLKTD